MTDRIDRRRPKQQGPETPEDNPPGTLEEVAPEDPRSPMLNDRSAEPLLPVEEMSSDTPKPPSAEKKIPSDAPVNPYIDPALPEEEPPEEWDEEAPPDDAPESDTPATPTNPLMDPDMPGGVPVDPGHPDTPVLQEDPKDHLPGDDAAEPGIPVKDPSPDTTEPTG